jgi:NAD-dependent dihydropyrimidine dehydrogenase PreA subunit
MLEIRNHIGEVDIKNTPEQSAMVQVMDECEILDNGQTYATTTYQTSWSDVKAKEFSSHELLDMAADGKTPLYLRDGDFIFIDEESCIGCMQCATTAPSSFLMLDHGRARTFIQRNDSRCCCCGFNLSGELHAPCIL